MLRKSLPFAGIAMIAAGWAMAQEDTEAAATRGGALAERWCAHCHVVGEQGRGTDAVPPLATVAARRNPEWLRGFLSEPHGPMPDLNLTTREIEDLTQYLATLR